MAGDFDQRYLDVMETAAESQRITDDVANWIHRCVTNRLTINQWLDENENEWKILDNMCRSRPWATNKDTPFPYPFRDATNEMRKAGEPLWLGDTPESLAAESKPSARKDAPNDVLTNIVPTKEYPPAQRILLFTPEFGASTSYSAQAWSEVEPKGNTDVWTVTWQGWNDFDQMIHEVYHWVETFADGVSTVWYGHSMGAIVMYECLKRMHWRQAPCLPVAVFVSGCPAPHLFEESYRPMDARPWLNRLRIPHDFEGLSQKELEDLQRDFSVHLEHPVEGDVQAQAYYGLPLPGYAVEKLASVPRPTAVQRSAVMEDTKLMRSYRFLRADDKPVLVPLVCFHSDEDELVAEEDACAWAEYTTDHFEAVALGEEEDGEVLAAMGHGFAKAPPRALLQKVQEVAAKFRLNKDVDDPSMLPDIGPTNGPMPEECDALIAGAGITGVCCAREFAKVGMKPLLVEKTDAIGGIWKYYANIYSRVNTSEVGYRIMDQEGPTARPNQDHSPRHDILRDIYTICAT